MFEKNNSQEKIYIIYLKSVSRGVVLSVLLLFITALVFHFTSLDQEMLRTIILIVTILSICYSSIYCALKVTARGFMHGSFAGAIYMMILLLIAFLAEKGQVNMKSSIIMFVMAIVIGALSGMIGMMMNNKG